MIQLFRPIRLCFLFALLTASLMLAACATDSSEKPISFTAKVDSKYFYLDGNPEKLFIKGVNMGIANPGHFPGEHAITKKEYLDWFQKIVDMNANTIRVYTVHPPEFYDALQAFNRHREQPLFLIHGVWLEEELIDSSLNGYKPGVMDRFKENARQVLDVVHGKADLPERRGYSDGKYRSDVSDYVIGYVLGIEWNPDFVTGTDAVPSEAFLGDYLTCTDDATGFEAFLASVGDDFIGYETETYRHQTPTSFTNWVSTDPLDHPNEPFESEDRVSVDMEHLKSTAAFVPGLFASYHIYPYYPESLVYQKEYREYRDASGKINNYAAYLKELRQHHTMPVLVAEFGIPSSRGISHQNPYTGFDQGHISEKDQGDMLVSMMQDIYDNGYAGGLVFTWQDEWFKRTWNTHQLNDPDRRPFWNDVMTNEQNFGLMAFDNADQKKISRPDGLTQDWAKDKPVGGINGNPIYIKNDEKYLYLMFKAPDLTEKDQLLFAIDSLDGQGNSADGENGLKLNLGAEFLVKIDGREKSTMTVDSYYDVFVHYYTKTGRYHDETPVVQKDSGQFNPIRLCISYGMTLPLDQIEYPFSSFDTGHLQFGNGNPESPEYDSLSDFMVRDGVAEIRIPWQLLNISDPSGKKMIGDVSSGEIAMVPCKGFNIEGIWQKAGQTEPMRSEIFTYDWDSWDQQSYVTRLKQSYFILQSYFENLK